MFLSIIVRLVGFLISIVLSIYSIISIIRCKNRRTIIFSIVLIVIALVIPYMMLFYGQYRNNSLRLKDNVADTISLINRLDIKYDLDPNKVEYNGTVYEIEDNGEDIYPNFKFIGTYEAELNGVDIDIDILKGDKPIDKDVFMSRSFIAEVTRYNRKKFISRVEYGENDEYYWTASPIVEYDNPTLKVHTGVYDGTFNISKGNIIYCCSYSLSTNVPPFITAFMNTKPEDITAEELINMFIGVKNNCAELE